MEQMFPDLILQEIGYWVWQSYRRDINIEYKSCDYKIHPDNDLVYIQWDHNFPLRKRLINNGKPGTCIYHIINNKNSLPDLADDDDFFWEYVVGPIPKKYKYSSGFNHPTAFKDIPITD